MHRRPRPGYKGGRCLVETGCKGGLCAADGFDEPTEWICWIIDSNPTTWRVVRGQEITQCRICTGDDEVTQR
eukprot:CAMPEP_0174728960 /NCGR_PEP_ID=MMETSP1094-20130205/52765_1 /TAXON_ID=156173 /ORGANISM="Chrysochromulina brevifilum, Strain UTEX LB 985" /LENGTH=71 /DNA_ID=CAMNT_0015930983 /DNA_START=477 /DNA_END=688 /DNA_ORIENTATION=-